MRISQDDASSPGSSLMRPSSNEDLLRNLGPLPVCGIIITIFIDGES